MTIPEQIASKAEAIVNSLVQTDYQHPEHIDAGAGVYDCDCNGFVGFLLDSVAAAHYNMIPKETDQPRPRAFKYYGFFASLTPEIPRRLAQDRFSQGRSRSRRHCLAISNN